MSLCMFYNHQDKVERMSEYEYCTRSAYHHILSLDECFPSVGCFVPDIIWCSVVQCFC